MAKELNFPRFYFSGKTIFVVIIATACLSLFVLVLHRHIFNGSKLFGTYMDAHFFIDIMMLVIITLTFLFTLGIILFNRSKKHVEKALKINSNEFEIFFYSSMDMLCIADKNGCFQHLNPEWERTLGYSISELEGKKFIELVHPDDIENTIKVTKEASEKKIISFINRYKHKNSSYRWIEWRSYPVGDVIYASARDITERKNSEEISLKNEARLLKAQQIGNLGYSEHYIKEQKIWATAEGMRIYGLPYSDGFVSLDNVISIMDDIVPFQIAIKELFENDRRFEIDYWIHPADGMDKKFIHAAVELERDINGAPWKIISTFQDITIRKNAEEALRIGEQKYRNLFENMTSGFALHQMIYDEHGKPADYRYLEANPAFEKLTGLQLNILIGKTIRELVPNIEDYWIQTFGNVALTGEPIFYLNYAKELGRHYDTFVFCPTPNQFAVVFNDVSDRIKAEEALKILNETLENKVEERTLQLEHANKDLESFAYSISHDLRAPLRHIDGFTKLMYSKITNPDEIVTEYFQKIEVASKRMSGMIDDLLSFSRLGRKELVISDININDIIDEILEQMKPDISKHNIKWILTPLPQISADKNLLKIAFENLISNAIKYSSKKEQAIIEIGYIDLSDEKVEIYIKDNGVGFDMAYVNKLFGVFQRLHSAEDFEGTGIGLAIVKQIINKQNGTIRAEGKPNEGATFYITLPK